MTQTTEISSVDKSEALARFIVETPLSAIPVEMYRKVERHTLDTIGAGIAGAISLEAQLLVKTLVAAGEPSGASALWAAGRTLPPISAALVNGTAAHAFELDDTGGCDHSGAVVVPAAIAAVEIARDAGRVVTGREFLAAVVIGYDVARRALEACGAYEAHNGAGFHSTGTCGPFGAAAAAARILGASVKETQMALGLASSFSGGLWACVHNGAQSKRLHAGHAASGGLFSVLLAREGFTGPTKIFEDVWGGFSKSFAPQSEDPDAWLKDLGRVWKLGRVSIKPHASCRSTHAAIDAIDNLRAAHGFGADDVEAIEVVINPFVFGMCGGFDRHPMPSAQLSIPYSLAADLVFGNASLASYARERRDDPRIKVLMERIRFTVDKTQADDEEPTVIVTLKDGRVLREHVPMPLGAPVNPVSDEALLKKFKSVSGMVLAAETVDKLAERLMTLDASEDVAADVVALLAEKPASTELFHV